MKYWLLFVIAAVICSSCLVSCTNTSSSDALIEYRRSGGILGLDDHLIIDKNGKAVLTRKSGSYEFTIGNATASYLQALFEQAEFSQLHKKYLSSQQVSDSLEYVVTYEGHTVRTMDDAVPLSLWPILEAFNQIVEDQGSP